MPKVFYVYILLCADQTYYVGLTSNLDDRMVRHHTAKYKNSYTASRLPVKLEHHEIYKTHKEASKQEIQLKKWTVAKKKALTNGKFSELPELAKKRF